MKIKNLDLPIDIKRYIRKKQTFRIMMYVVFTALFAFFVIKWGDVILAFPKELIAFQYLAYALVLIAPFFFTEVYRVFTDRCYVGEVKKIDIKSTVDNKNPAHPTREHLYIKTIMSLTIETPNGKMIKKKVFEGETRMGDNLDSYKTGDMVLHLHGTNVTVVLPTSKDTHCHCAICGGVNEKVNDECIHCGMPLVKSVNYVKKGEKRS